MVTPERGPLQGIGVLITRPQHQAAGLCEAIESLGGRAVRFPVMEIVPAPDNAQLSVVIDTLDTFDWAVFISANAVEQGLQRVRAVRDWPSGLKVAAIGRRSAQELLKAGLEVDLVPQDGYSSEALLALPAMQAVNGQRVVIFRGNGGRELLAETLRKRGATVEYAQAYQRRRPLADTAQLVQSWQRGDIDIVTVNSAESLLNLVEMLGHDAAQLLHKTPLLIVSERLLSLARKWSGGVAPVLAENATDEAVVAALSRWAQQVQ